MWTDRVRHFENIVQNREPKIDLKKFIDLNKNLLI